jgi:UDP-N-acetylglucosamine 4-epimerase
VGERTSLNQLHDCIKALLAEHAPGISALTPEYGPFREGDVRHSQADISRARELLGFQPSHDIHRGLKVTSDWFMESASQSKESL